MLQERAKQGMDLADEH